MKRIFAALLLLSATSTATPCQEWRQGDALMLNVRATISCDMAPLMREWHRILEENRVSDAIRFAMTYCRRIAWAPVPLIVDLEDDFSGEPNPGVCVRQINWNSCEWIGREYLTPFNPNAAAPAPVK